VFVKTYYSTAIASHEELIKFYAPYASVSRRERVVSVAPDRSRGVSRVALGIALGSVLTILRFHLTPLGPNYYISVEGRIDCEWSSAGFSQLLTLSEDHDRVWITADIATLVTGDGFKPTFGRPPAPSKAQRRPADQPGPAAAPRRKSRRSSHGGRRRREDASQWVWKPDERS
jgi:hypothetical protein